ncbi:60S ribosomal protein L12 [Iris pallida]|uniref:60S ribosomal protein L12 n=1 Tax=Iris pallida TaxID=29817 RepID=A0AAX6DLF0_IRIPA|nr:60S ribosomal protein L12 [Iris pallida]
MAPRSMAKDLSGTIKEIRDVRQCRVHCRRERPQGSADGDFRRGRRGPARVMGSVRAFSEELGLFFFDVYGHFETTCQCVLIIVLLGLIG